MNHSFKLGFGFEMVVALGFAGCSPTPIAATEPAQQPIASIQELMLQVVDPSADELWESVSATFTKTESIIKEPKTDADWDALRRHALILAEAPNLLVVKGRPVAVEGGKVADEGSPGILTTFQIQNAIAKDPARFAAAARKLQDTAEEMIRVIDRRDIPGVEMVGSEIDEACESCHTQYWYPSGEAPK